MKEPTVTKTRKRTQRSKLAGAKGFPGSVTDKLTAYYRQNIRKFPKKGSVNDLRNLIISPYYHSTSADTNSRHEYCDTSFCMVRRAAEKGEVPVPILTIFVHLGADIHKSIFAVYVVLAAPGLLWRCKRIEKNPNPQREPPRLV